MGGKWDPVGDKGMLVNWGGARGIRVAALTNDDGQTLLVTDGEWKDVTLAAVEADS